MPSYEYQPYPKMVYTPDGKSVVINSADEWPDGYLSFEDWKAGKSPTTGSKDDPVVNNAQKDAEKAERERLRAYLDEHNVDYPKNLSLPKLRALADELTAYLLNKAGNNDNGA